jgi:hypothetical protein
MFKAIRNKESAFLFDQLPAKGDAEIFFLAWTTTPWTLPSNLGLTVGPDIEYTLVQTFNPYTQLPVMVVLAKSLLGKYFKPEDQNVDFGNYQSASKTLPWKILFSFDGARMENCRYEQLIPSESASPAGGTPVRSGTVVESGVSSWAGPGGANADAVSANADAVSAVAGTLLIRRYAGAEQASAWGMTACCLVAILFCGLIGAASGFLVTRFAVPSFIITLGVLKMARGAAFKISDGESVYHSTEHHDLASIQDRNRQQVEDAQVHRDQAEQPDEVAEGPLREVVRRLHDPDGAGESLR